MSEQGCTDCGRGFDVDFLHLDCDGDSAPWGELIAEGEFRMYARASGQVLCAGHSKWWISDTCITCGAVV